MTTLSAALTYARLGWPVFPVRPDKKPMHGYEHRRLGTRWAASSDPTIVKLLFGRESLVGLTAGLDARDPRAEWLAEPVPGSRIFFIDVDVAKPGGHSSDGAPKLDALCLRHGSLPVTLTSIGLDGGRHYVFNNPQDRRVVSRVLVDERGEKLHGVDVKGEGGYVVAPPSRGRRWIDWSVPVADAPDWLLDLVCKQPHVAVRRTSASPRASSRRWTWRPPDRKTVECPPELLALLTEDAGCGMSPDPRDYADLLPLRKLHHALEVIPNDRPPDYDDWIKMGASIYNHAGDAGFPLFDEWSRKNPAYDKELTKFKWDQDNGVSGFPLLSPGAKVFALANQHDKQRMWKLRWLAEAERELHRGLGL